MLPCAHCGIYYCCFSGAFECSLVRRDKNEKNSSAIATVITAFRTDVFEEKAMKERRMGAESTTSTSRANIKGLIVVFHFASSSGSLPLPQPNLISCCSCSSVYSLTSLLFPFVLSSDLIHICHRDYRRWTDIRDQLRWVWGLPCCWALPQYSLIYFFLAWQQQMFRHFPSWLLQL